MGELMKRKFFGHPSSTTPRTGLVVEGWAVFGDAITRLRGLGIHGMSSAFQFHP